MPIVDMEGTIIPEPNWQTRRPDDPGTCVHPTRRLLDALAEAEHEDVPDPRILKVLIFGAVMLGFVAGWVTAIAGFVTYFLL